MQRAAEWYWPWLDYAGARWARSAAAGGRRRAGVRRWRARLWVLAALGALGGPAAELPARGALVWLLYRAGAEFCRSRGVDPTAPAVLADLRREVYRGLATPSRRSIGPGFRLFTWTGRWVAPTARAWAWVEGGSLVWELCAASQECRRLDAALGRLDLWADRVAVKERSAGAPTPG